MSMDPARSKSTDMVPLTVKKARFTFFNSSAFTSVCSNNSRNAVINIEILKIIPLCEYMEKRYKNIIVRKWMVLDNQRAFLTPNLTTME